MSERKDREVVNPVLQGLLDADRKINEENVQKLTARTSEGSLEGKVNAEAVDRDGGEAAEKAAEAGSSNAGAGQSAENSPGEGRSSGGAEKDSEALARDRDPVEVQEGVERNVYRIAAAQGEIQKQADENREQLFVELAEEIHRAARWEVRDTVMEVLSGPAEAIAGTGHACAILASVARGEGDIGRGLGEASGVLGIVQRYLDRDSVTVRGEAMKLDKVLGTEGRVAARIGAAKQLIGAAQEELRFVPAEREPAQKAAHAAVARLGAAQIEMSTVFGAVGAVDEESLPHVPGVDRGGVPESAELREARAFRLDFYRGQKRQALTMRAVRYGLVAAAVVVAAVVGRVSPYLDGLFGSVAGALF